MVLEKRFLDNAAITLKEVKSWPRTNFGKIFSYF